MSTVSATSLSTFCPWVWEEEWSGQLTRMISKGLECWLPSTRLSMEDPKLLPLDGLPLPPLRPRHLLNPRLLILTTQLSLTKYVIQWASNQILTTVRCTTSAP